MTECNVGYELEQPAEITRPVLSMGKLAARFGSGMWALLSGTPILTQGYTGWDGNGNKTGISSRTGLPDILKVVPGANTTEQIELQSFATNMATPSLGGVIGLWVYVEMQPGYQPAGIPIGNISITMSTNSANYTNGVSVGFNASQVREGWNFLQFRMRNFAAYQQGSGIIEDHPYGVLAVAYGTGVDSNLITTNIARIKISWFNLSGTTLYFDSLWTGFSSKSQIVLGCDRGPLLEEIAVPIFDSYGWVGYIAFSFNAVDSSTSNCTVQVDMTGENARMRRLYDKGWDVVNHTMTHPRLGEMTDEGLIVYQTHMARQWLQSNEFFRGCEFYASPQGRSSRLSEKVIKALGFKLQRHGRKNNTSVTAFGVDNPQHVGGLGWGSGDTACVSTITGGINGSVSGLQQFSKIKRVVDVMEAYGDTAIFWWHGITTTGDSGSGEDLTGDNLLITKSAITKAFEYVREREIAGGITVCKGITGFWYGNNA